MNAAKPPMRTTPKMKVPGPGFPWKRLSAILLAVVLTSFIVWVVYFYKTHAMVNVAVAGAPVGLASHEEVEHVVAQKAAKLQVNFKTKHKTASPTLENIGMRINQPATVNAAFGARRLEDMPDSLQLWQTQNVPLTVSVNQQKLEQYVKATFPNIYKAPKQPNLEFSREAGQFQLIPGRNGRGFDIAAIAEKIESQAANPGSVTIRPTTTPVLPSVSDVAAVFTQDQANQRLWLRLEFLYQQKLIYYPEPSEIASWMTFAPDGSGVKLSIHYDTARMDSFLRRKVEPSLNRFFGPGSEIDQASETPLRLADTQDLITDMLYALHTKQPITKEVEVVSVGTAPETRQ